MIGCIAKVFTQSYSSLRIGVPSFSVLPSSMLRRKIDALCRQMHQAVSCPLHLIAHQHFHIGTECVVNLDVLFQSQMRDFVAVSSSE